MRIEVEIAPGELFDKLTILEIKSERISDAEKLRHVRAERESLEMARDRDVAPSPELDALYAELKALNEALWDIEDRLRVLERAGDFGADFVGLARSVYITNDRRAAVKLRINRMLGSDIAEAKSYEAY
jgi:hypothetical protein